MGEPTFVFGLLLRLATTEEGGRATPLGAGYGGGRAFHYRPNWGLPGLTPPEQAGAPVLGFDRDTVAPGDSARIVIVPLAPSLVPEWATVTVGDELPMYEGRRVCGHGRVLWRRATTAPLPDADADRFRRWLASGTERSEPEDDVPSA